ncbi:MAG: hypothetical protein ACREXY_19345 [Gammaproteobacteria bacterium]
MNDWRSGPREAVRPADPLHPTQHPLGAAHVRLVEAEAREKFAALLGKLR